MVDAENRAGLPARLKQKRLEQRGAFREGELASSGVLDQMRFYERRRHIDVTLRLKAEPFRDGPSYAGYDRKHSTDAYRILAISSTSGEKPALAIGNYVVLEVPPEQSDDFVSGDVVRIESFVESQFQRRGLFVVLIAGNSLTSIPIEWVKSVVDPAGGEEGTKRER